MAPVGQAAQELAMETPKDFECCPECGNTHLTIEHRQEMIDYQSHFVIDVKIISCGEDDLDFRTGRYYSDGCGWYHVEEEIL